MSSISPPHTSKEKIFVGGLKLDTTEKTLSDYFSKFGPIKSTIVIKHQITFKSRCFGFCVFYNPEDALSAVSYQEHIIDDRKVEVKFAVPRDMNKNLLYEVAYIKKIFVGGLTLDTTERDLVEYFSNFGVVDKCFIMNNKDNNRSRGFAYVIFESEEVVQTILSIKDHVINGKEVDVKIANPKKPSSHNEHLFHRLEYEPQLQPRNPEYCYRPIHYTQPPNVYYINNPGINTWQTPMMSPNMISSHSLTFPKIPTADFENINSCPTRYSGDLYNSYYLTSMDSASSINSSTNDSSMIDSNYSMSEIPFFKSRSRANSAGCYSYF